MRKLIVAVFVCIFLLCPVIASADSITTDQYLGTVTLVLSADDFEAVVLSDSSVHYYATDYEAFADGSDTPVEIFCVEDEAAHLGQEIVYSLYTLESDDDTNKLIAWIAEKYWESDKELAQLAIWVCLNIIDDASNDELSEEIYYTILAAADLVDFSDSSNDYTNNWLIATKEGEQDYLIRATAPVPEPATMLLLGTGLVGLAGASRKKFKK